MEEKEGAAISVLEQDSLSMVSQSSIAIVSLYKNWSCSDLGSAHVNTENGNLVDGPGVERSHQGLKNHVAYYKARTTKEKRGRCCWDSKPEVNARNTSSASEELTTPAEDIPLLSAPELLLRLRKRCREEDLPPTPSLRQRKNPTCLFLNYMGTRQALVPNAMVDNRAFKALVRSTPTPVPVPLKPKAKKLCNPNDSGNRPGSNQAFPKGHGDSDSMPSMIGSSTTKRRCREEGGDDYLLSTSYDPEWEAMLSSIHTDVEINGEGAESRMAMEILFHCEDPILSFPATVTA